MELSVSVTALSKLAGYPFYTVSIWNQLSLFHTLITVVFSNINNNDNN